VLDTRSPRALLRVSDAGARRTRPARLPGAVHRLARDRRRSPGAAADPDARRDRRVRAGENRRALPAWEAVPGARRRGDLLEGPIRLPARPPHRGRPSAPGDSRARSGDRARHLRRVHRGRAVDAGDHPPPLRARRSDADRTRGVGQLNARRDVAQPHLHGHRRMVPARDGRAASAGQVPRPPDSPARGGLGSCPGPSDRHRRSVRRRATRQD
jgi:hypothetical protein